MQPEKINRYEIKAELGRGGMATVYLAHDPRFKRDVAIKILPFALTHEPTFRARFEREAQTLAALEFPGIVPVYDFGEENEQPYLVMRYMPGASLYQRLREGPLSIPESSRILTRLADALDYVHAQGIIHRDLKPANILFDLHGFAYLSDFGIAHLTETSVALTGTGMIGTPAYMSPEQARGDKDIDGRSDIYALGAIVFEMLTGKQPYEATTPMGVAVKHITDPVPRILAVKADLPAACQELIEHAMAKDRQQRFPTAAEMASVLAHIAVGVSEAPPATFNEQLPTLPPIEPPVVKPVAPVYVEQPAVKPVTPSPPYPQSPAGQAQSPKLATPPPLVRQAQFAGQPVKPVKKPLRWPIWVALGGGLLLVTAVCMVLGIGTLIHMSQPTPESATPDVGLGLYLAPQVTSTLSLTTTTEFSPLPTPGAILLEDDFLDPSSGWDSYRGSDGIKDYENGFYRILVDMPHTDFISTPGSYFEDLRLEVEATKVSGPDDNYFGLLCRYQDESNYYFFLISSDGYYALGKLSDGTATLLGMDGMLYSPNIHRGETTNTLTAECISSHLGLYANGVRLAEADDPSFSYGDVGLIVGSFETQGANLLFDHFVVTQP